MLLLKSISNTDTTLSVTVDAAMPASNGVIQIGSERIIYDDNYMGTLYGCLRGAQSTVAAPHTLGTTVSLVNFYSAFPGTPDVSSASNVGTGEGTFAQKVLDDLQFKSLVEGTNITITSSPTEITITSTDTGEVNTASNVGSGEGIFAQKVLADLQLKSLTAGSGLLLTPSIDDISMAIDSSWFNGALTVDNTGLGTLGTNIIIGSNITLGSLATGSLTVVDYTNLVGAYFDISDMQALSSISLTEGVDWTAAISNDATALSIKNAINTIASRSPEGIYIRISATVLANVITVTSLIASEDQNCTFTNVPTPYLTAVDMSGGVGDFFIPGDLTGNYRELLIRGDITTQLGNIIVPMGNLHFTYTFPHVPSASQPQILLDTAGNSGVWGGGGNVYFTSSGIDIGIIGATNAPRQVSLHLFDHDTGTMVRVSVGDADSGGVGYKVLRIPN